MDTSRDHDVNKGIINNQVKMSSLMKTLTLVTEVSAQFFSAQLGVNKSINKIY